MEGAEAVTLLLQRDGGSIPSLGTYICLLGHGDRPGSNPVQGLGSIPRTGALPRDPEKQKAAKLRWYYKNRERQMARQKERRRELRSWLSKEFKSVPCERCGEEHPGVLEFHHLEPDKKEVALADAVSKGWSRERIRSEVEVHRSLRQLPPKDSLGFAAQNVNDAEVVEALGCEPRVSGFKFRRSPHFIHIRRTKCH